MAGYYPPTDASSFSSDSSMQSPISDFDLGLWPSKGLESSQFLDDSSLYQHSSSLLAGQLGDDQTDLLSPPATLPSALSSDELLFSIELETAAIPAETTTTSVQEEVGSKPTAVLDFIKEQSK